MTPGDKKESLLGIVLTAVLCGGFLYWWFSPNSSKPQPPVWQHESVAQLVARAAAEPPPADPAQRLVLDLDYMETAIGQARMGLIDDAQKTAGHIGDPDILTEAVRNIAHAYLNSDPTDLRRTLRIADMIKDAAERTAVRSEIVSSLAVMGYPDAAIPEAKTAVQKAALGRRLASTDAQDQARQLLTAAAAALPGLSPAEAAAVREELAWAAATLSVTDGPQKAIDAIKALPPDRQPLLWDELASWCAGREDRETSLRTVVDAIPDPAVRLKVETDSLLTAVKPRPAGELEAQARATLAATTTPGARHTAFLSLAKIQRNSALPDPAKAEAAAALTLRDARTNAAAIANPAARAAALAEITRRSADLNQLPDAIAILTDATAAARSIPDPAARIPVLIDLAEEWLNQARAADNTALIAEAAALAEAGPAEARALNATAAALIRRSGDWPRAAALLLRIPDPAARRTATAEAAAEAAENCLSADPVEPPPRGQPVDGIRAAAAGDEFKAAALVEAQPPGYAKARAWLAMAKGLNAPPASLLETMTTPPPPPGPEPEPEPEAGK